MRVKVGQKAVAGATEPMRRDLHFDGDHAYRIGFVIEHNPDGRKGAGSCIFAHLWKSPTSPTAGCTAMTDDTMERLLGWLDPAKKPVFVLLPKNRIRPPARSLEPAGPMTATQRILLGLALGAVTGIALATWAPAFRAEHVADAVQPMGKLWLSALQMTVVPLVLSLVVVGANTATDAAASGRIARRAIVVFLLLLSLGAVVAAIAAPALFTLFPRSGSLTAALGATGGHLPASAPIGWSDWLAGIVPTNAIMAAAESAMLPLVVFAMFLGFALTASPRSVVRSRWSSSARSPTP